MQYKGVLRPGGQATTMMPIVAALPGQQRKKKWKKWLWLPGKRRDIFRETEWNPLPDQHHIAPLFNSNISVINPLRIPYVGGGFLPVAFVAAVPAVGFHAGIIK